MNYLYNGVPLPDIYSVYTPELQKTHPYASISYSILGTFTILSVWQTKPVMLNSQMGTPPGVERIPLMDSYLASDGLSWGEFSESYLSNVGSAQAPFWSNFDILNADGTLYLAASDPIPVNPAPTLDPTALLMGWQVGNRIASMKK